MRDAPHGRAYRPKANSARCSVLDIALDARHDQGIGRGQGGNKPFDARGEVRIEIDETQGKPVDTVVSDHLGGDFNGSLPGVIVERKCQVGAHFEFWMGLDPHALGREVVACQQGGHPAAGLVEPADMTVEAGPCISPSVGMARQGDQCFPYAEQSAGSDQQALARGGFEISARADGGSSQESADPHAQCITRGMKAKRYLPLFRRVVVAPTDHVSREGKFAVPCDIAPNDDFYLAAKRNLLPRSQQTPASGKIEECAGSRPTPGSRLQFGVNAEYDPGTRASALPLVKQVAEQDLDRVDVKGATYQVLISEPAKQASEDFRVR